MTTQNKLTLQERATAFRCFDLPGSTHMGTSYLVNDLAKEVEKLTAERDALLLANIDLKDWFDALKTDHDALMTAGKLALEALDLTYQLEFKTLPSNIGFSDVYNKQLGARMALKRAGVQ